MVLSLEERFRHGLRVVSEQGWVVPGLSKCSDFADTFADSGRSNPPNRLMPKHHGMEPVVGFEPTTDGLQNRCSTTELNWLTTRQFFYVT
jgi:hypothetical protein